MEKLPHYHVPPDQLHQFIRLVEDIELTEKTEGDVLLNDLKIPGDTIESDSMRIELVDGECGDVIHFHYRDFRLELRIEEFLQLSNLFAKARQSFVEYTETM